MPAYAYVRQSRSDEDNPSQSPFVQADRIRALAAARDPELVMLEPDLNVSGGKAMEARPAFAVLLEAIRSGKCTAVYAYDLSRLFRNLKEQIAFFELTDAKGIPVRFVEGAVTEVAGPTGKLILAVLGAMNEWQREMTSVKIRDSLRRRERDTGQHNGQKPYGAKPGEDPAVVVAAFEEAGSFNEAARLLNARGWPTRVAGRLWSGSVVRDVVARTDAGRHIPPRKITGKPAGPSRTFRLARLLVCSVCGKTLTGSWDPRRDEARYLCPGHRVARHPRGWVSEQVLMPLVAEEASRLRLVIGERRRKDGVAGDAARALDLATQRERLADLYLAGVIDAAGRDRRLAAIREEEAALTATRWVRGLHVPPDVETGDVPGVNGFLRRLFRSITIPMGEPAKRGPSSWRPRLAFEWSDPGLRLTDEELRHAG